MSDEASPRLSLPFLMAGQAQKEITHNEALQRLDALVQPAVLSADLAVPPGSPAVGACWIVAPAPSGAWSGRAGDIAQWTAGGWRFLAPSAGWRCHVADRNAVMRHDGASWIDAAVRGDGIYIDGNKVVGERLDGPSAPTGGTVVDVEARTVINEILMVLNTHGLTG